MALSLYQKILQIYPTLTAIDFYPGEGSIVLQNDGNGDYIASWTNTNPQPTAEQLAALDNSAS
jgi:hypothetical protein